MSVLIYVVGGVSIAVGALTAGRYLLSLPGGPAWRTRLRRWARIRPAAKPRARRRAWNEFGIGLGSVLTGTLLVLSVGDPAIGRLTLIALVALLVWQLASGLTQYVHAGQPADICVFELTRFGWRSRRTGWSLRPGWTLPTAPQVCMAGAGVRRRHDVYGSETELPWCALADQAVHGLPQ